MKQIIDGQKVAAKQSLGKQIVRQKNAVIIPQPDNLEYSENKNKSYQFMY